MGDIFEDIDWTEGMEVPVKRRVAALREVQEEADKLQKAFNKEQAELEVKYQKLTSESCMELVTVQAVHLGFRFRVPGSCTRERGGR